MPTGADLTATVSTVSTSEEPAGTFGGGRLARRLLLLAIVGVCALVYSPIWDHEFVNFDDDLFIYENEAIRTLEWPAIARLFQLQILTPFYKPLVYLSWALEHHFFGLDPRAFHLDNLLLHLANVALVYQLLWLLSASARRFPGATAWGVFLATAMFALHPMRVESVAWATERKDVLFGLFFLSSLITYCHYVIRRRTVFLAASCLLFLFGTLSKAAIVSLPLTLFLIDCLLERRDWRRLLLDKVPYAAILLCALGLYGFLFRAPPPAPLESGGGLIMVSADPAEAGLQEGVGAVADPLRHRDHRLGVHQAQTLVGDRHAVLAGSHHHLVESGRGLEGHHERFVF